AAKGRGDEAEFERLRGLVAEKKADVARMQAEAAEMDAQLRDLLMGIPNLPLDSIPDGVDEADNVEIRRWGDPRGFDFSPVEHYEIAGVKPGMDFETAAKLSGSRFVVLKGAVARIHRA
ncbi:serine--tRNA ligase, partial [Glutamicibacter soli]|nr:serine--tRNA ligase [Glutamicibacter soli]